MKKKRNRSLGWIALYLAPILVLFGAFFVYPLLFNVYTSLMKWKGAGAMTWNNFGNYTKLLGDDTFLLSMKNNLIWALSQGFIQIPLAAIVALILAREPKGWKAMRTIYFLPNVISTVAIAMVWVALYNPQYGVVNALVTAFGGKPHNWLGDPSTSLPAIIAMTVIYIGYFMIIILASIMNIPRELYEAAEIDGASKIQQAWFISLPMVKSSILTCITLAAVMGLRQFEQVYLLTNGGPANRTSTMVLYLYKQIQNTRYGPANAASVMLICVGVIVILGIRALFQIERKRRK
jgi:raffinose/stachyose/melibiose transport system permease protein